MISTRLLMRLLPGGKASPNNVVMQVPTDSSGNDMMAAIFFRLAFRKGGNLKYYLMEVRRNGEASTAR